MTTMNNSLIARLDPVSHINVNIKITHVDTIRRVSCAKQPTTLHNDLKQRNKGGEVIHIYITLLTKQQ